MKKLYYGTEVNELILEALTRKLLDELETDTNEENPLSGAKMFSATTAINNMKAYKAMAFSIMEKIVIEENTTEGNTTEKGTT